MNTLDRSATIAQIVLDHPECAKVFQDHGLDFCCRGNRTLSEACGATVDRGALEAALEAAIAARVGDPALDPRTLSTPDLIEHIVSRHHLYLRQALPFLEPLAAKVARVHGDHEPRLREVLGVFRDLRAALEPHLDREEEVLFPAIALPQPDRAVVDAELQHMHVDHLAVGAMLSNLRMLTDEFAPPEWACGSYRALFSELAALEGDVLRHVHLENHVLMPRFSSTSTPRVEKAERRAPDAVRHGGV